MQKILTSVGMIVFAAALVAGATGAFFSDTETSTGNTFTAGALDLKVDSVAHYNNMICTPGEQGSTWQPEEGAFPNGVPADHYPQPGMPCTGSWTESDLIPDSLALRFFNLLDLKPGDAGENTISLHVYDNDAWGCFLVDKVQDLDVTCTEPESEDADDASCTPAGIVADGELGGALTFDAWLDEGTDPGFQCNNGETNDASCEADPEEGDNILNGAEQIFWNDETINAVSEGPFALSDILSAAYVAHECTVATGHTDYESCHGLAEDGRMVGSVTYYWGLAWNIPDAVGNEIQTDSLVSDMIFEVAQHRNNPDFSCTRPTNGPRTTLTLAKTVVTADIEPDSSFTLTADGPGDSDISGIEGAPSVTAALVTPGSYTLGETGGQPEDGTPVVTWECFGNADPEIGNTVNVAAGENVVCLVTNDYTPAPLVTQDN